MPGNLLHALRSFDMGLTHRDCSKPDLYGLTHRDIYGLTSAEGPKLVFYDRKIIFLKVL